MMGILVAEGLFAFMMMFIFPPASIMMVFFGLITIGASIVVKFLLNALILLLCKFLKVDPPIRPESANPAAA